VNVLVLADTHVPDHARVLPPALAPHLEWAEVILHGGDITSAATLAELETHAPVHAVCGNIDQWELRERLPDTLQLQLGGVTVGMVHDSGPREGRERRLRRRFPEASLIVFAHSHQPVNEVVDGVHFLNPGSPTWKRRAPTPTVARMVASSGGVEVTLVDLA
jgi:putative phosphoesterase